jgi:UDP-N-acetylglucosamine/UDP-N-acetylgalactosamine diphosphorylase
MTPVAGATALAARCARCRAQLAAAGQEHVLRWWPQLEAAERELLLADIESVPWAEVAPLVATHVLRRPEVRAPRHLEPAPVHPATPDRARAEAYRAAARRGHELLREGRVAAFTVAGGQGTRLGVNGPKGAVAVTPLRHKSLFQLFAESILAARRRCGAALPWYVMTSSANHQATADFLRRHEHFGLPEGDVILFQQGMLPAFGFDGRVLMESRSRLALAPDGHGGSLKALSASGALADMGRRGIEVISYFQVDNPLVKPLDPLFIGLHAGAGSEMSTKVTPKADDFERVGNICRDGERLVVIEYTDFPPELATARTPEGRRRFDVGNLALHLLDVSFVERLAGGRFRLPYNRAEKKVPCIDGTGARMEPATPNGVKLEAFVFDALPLARNALLLEIDRGEEFSPVKNATGVDSLETSQRDQVRRAARWLEAAGVSVPRRPDGEPDALLEISPLLASDAAELRERLREPPRVPRGGRVYLE